MLKPDASVPGSEPIAFFGNKIYDQKIIIEIVAVLA
jgi:hypothetical protein